MQGRVLELEEENQELRREKEEIAEELEAEKIVNAKVSRKYVLEHLDTY